MDPDLVKRLLALNRSFYAEFSADFSATRSPARLELDPLRPFLRNGIRLLDVGCGNGRLTAALEQAGLALSYTGVDASPDLIARGRALVPSLSNVRARFEVADLAAPGWSSTVSEGAPFDVAVALAVLHHLPGSELRRALLSELYPLLKPNGHLILSNWQFTRSERLRRKIVPPDRLGIDPSTLDPNDFLLDWKRGGVGYRYVHLLTPTELRSLAAASGFHVLDQFDAEGGLNLYSILQRA